MGYELMGPRLSERWRTVRQAIDVAFGRGVGLGDAKGGTRKEPRRSKRDNGVPFTRERRSIVRLGIRIFFGIV